MFDTNPTNSVIITMKQLKNKALDPVRGVEIEKQLYKSGQILEKSYLRNQTYLLKQGYVSDIIANIVQEEQGIYGKTIKSPEILDPVNKIESMVVSKFQPFYGNTSEKIKNELGLELNQKAKSYLADLTNAILGLELGKKNEGFQKAAIRIKTIRLKENNLPKEDISFPTFKYKELIEIEWEKSRFKNILESKFFFVFYQFDVDDLILRKVQFWNMPYSDILTAKKVWDDTVKNINQGKIVREITDKGIRKTFFPKKAANRISHVRPHAKDKYDTYSLPIADKLTGLTEYTKHCFWLNGCYIRDEIYFK